MVQTHRKPKSEDPSSNPPWSSWDSPRLKFCYFSFWLAFFVRKTSQRRRSVLVESQACCIFGPAFGFWPLQTLAEICFFMFFTKNVKREEEEAKIVAILTLYWHHSLYVLSCIRYISVWWAPKSWLEYTKTQHMKSWSKYTTDKLKSEKLVT